jgi:hypothetical protein
MPQRQRDDDGVYQIGRNDEGAGIEQPNLLGQHVGTAGFALGPLGACKQCHRGLSVDGPSTKSALPAGEQ